jgi:PRTRC genetic system protein C
MSTLKAEALMREFHYNGIRIRDPGPELSVEQIRDLLTPRYWEIATASVSGPEATGGSAARVWQDDLLSQAEGDRSGLTLTAPSPAVPGRRWRSFDRLSIRGFNALV